MQVKVMRQNPKGSWTNNLFLTVNPASLNEVDHAFVLMEQRRHHKIVHLNNRREEMY